MKNLKIVSIAGAAVSIVTIGFLQMKVKQLKRDRDTLIGDCDLAVAIIEMQEDNIARYERRITSCTKRIAVLTDRLPKRKRT